MTCIFSVCVLLLGPRDNCGGECGRRHHDDDDDYHCYFIFFSVDIG